ncbi:MAG: MotA/TolQ/ExbB proton channel family protein [Cyanobacteria bacterium HKST-UBA05]|nr:MotA/TolQ/ExbB proton channel family protein [Cyanobacteria bacterium HKST-UBA05]
MNYTTILGLTIGVLIVLAALAFTGTPVSVWLQPEALLIVLGGSMTACMVHYSFTELRQTVGAVKTAMTGVHHSPKELANIVGDAATFIRARGALAAQPLLSAVHDPLLQKGLQMIVDGQPLRDIEHKLGLEIEGQLAQRMKYSKILEFAGGVAPTMGIIGAIVGLIQVSGLLNNPAQMGQGIAGAFSATLYGVGLSNLILLPLSGRLRQLAQQQWHSDCMAVEGLISIAQQDHPTLTREKLEAYLAHLHCQHPAEPSAQPSSQPSSQSRSQPLGTLPLPAAARKKARPISLRAVKRDAAAHLQATDQGDAIDALLGDAAQPGNYSPSELF